MRRPGILCLALGLSGHSWLSGCSADTESVALVVDNQAADYRVDHGWPRQLPDNWTIGQVSGLAVDRHNNIWIVQRPGSITDREAGAEADPPESVCCYRAPPVIQFDPEGNVLRAWGGPGDGYEWPLSEHGIWVDGEDNVWIGSNGPGANHVLKFTQDGEFLFQIGRSGVSGGSNDTSSLGGPAAIFVDDENGEVFIADGYVNRRVIVFEAATGEYRRHWGAYGNVPEDGPLEPYGPEAPPAQQFRGPVHGVRVSNDGLVYVADRGENRVQVFRRDGTFVDEAFIRRETRSMGSTWDVQLSRDPDQRFMYVADGTNYRVWVVRRNNLELVGEFGNHGRNAGSFGWLHNIAMDSHGNLYTSEVENYKRVQKFVPARLVGP
jgi:hypothetical protein